MSDIIVLELPWPPTGNTAVRHAGGKHYLTQAVKTFRQQVWAIAHQAEARKCLCLPQEVAFLAFSPDKRVRDADNLQKSLCDALTGAGVWKDDSNKIIRRSTFEWADEIVKGGKIVVTIRPYRKEIKWMERM